jgi:hypothetical protein
MKDAFIVLMIYYLAAFVLSSIRLAVVVGCKVDSILGILIEVIIHLGQLAVYIYGFIKWAELEDHCLGNIAMIFFFIFSLLVFLKFALIVLICVCICPFLCLFFFVARRSEDDQGAPAPTNFLQRLVTT